MSRMHYSRPAARRVLAALRRFGGSATTWQLLEVLRSVAVHSDIASLRVYAREDLGLQVDEPVKCELVSRQSAGDSRPQSRIYRYTLCPELMRPRQSLLFTAGGQS